MATESSAVFRFIDSVQKQQQTIQEPGAGLPDFTDDLEPTSRSYKVPLLILGLLLFAVGPALAGAYVGKHYLDTGKSTRQAVVAPAAAPAPNLRAPAPGPAAAPALSPAPVAPAIAPEVLAETGFDIRVKPPATISLDGRLIGRAPLRVRNLVPGEHVIEIEAPPGFFSRRVDVELDAGEPQNVNLALDPIHPPPEAAAGRGAEPNKSRRERRRWRRKAQSLSHRASHQTLQVDAGEARRRLPPPPGGKGRLMVSSKPPCDIYIDGTATGLKTPQRAIELSAGSHRVTLVNSELGIEKTFQVEISRGKSTRTVHDLTGKI